MKTGSDRQAADTPRRRVGNLYERLQEARAQRAKILATPDAANKSTPVEKKVVPARVVAEKKSPGRERLPRLKPADLELPLVPAPESKPVASERRSSWWMWGVALLIAAAATAYTLNSGPQGIVTVTTDTASITAPDSAGETPVLPAITASPEPQTASELATTSPDQSLERADLATMPDVLSEAPVVASAVPLERPRQNPRNDSTVERALPPGLQITPDEVGFNVPFRTYAPLNLRLSVNLPRTFGNTATQDVATKLEALGLDWGTPKYFNFNVNQTQVRYFHKTDKADAGRLAEAFDARLRDFTSFRPLPPEGRVELWIAGRSSAPRQQSSEPESVFDGVRRDLRQLGTDLQGAIRSITGDR